MALSKGQEPVNLQGHRRRLGSPVTGPSTARSSGATFGSSGLGWWPSCYWCRCSSRVPFMVWSLATLVLFGTMEGVGVAKVSDKCPPLTDIIREYIPRWLAFALIYFMVGMAGGTWFRFAHRWGLALLAGLLGWLTAHFEVTFNAPAVEQESVKYSWWAGKLGAHKLRDSLVRRQQRRSLDEQRRLAFKSGR